MRKKCGMCGRNRLLKFFAIRIAATGLRQSWCKSCRAIYDQNRYDQRERTRGCEKSRLVRERNRAFMREFLGAHPCVDCGESDWVVLEFDHVAGTKSFDISNAVRLGYSLRKIQEEIAKCEVRCANCHRRRTSWTRASHRTRTTGCGLAW